MTCLPYHIDNELDLDTALAKLRDLEKVIDTIENLAQTGHYEWSEDRDCLISCSEQYARIFEMTVAQVLEAHSSWEGAMKQVHPDDVEHYSQAAGGAGAISNNEPYDVRYRIQLADNTIKHLREINVILNKQDKTAKPFIGILQDITEQVKRERDLGYRYELSQQVESITDIGHFIYDELSEKYTYISKGFARILGTTVEAYMAKVQSLADDLSDVHPDDFKLVEAEYEHFLKTTEECVIEYRIIRSNGEIRWISERNKAQQLKNGKVFQTLGVIQDITEQKKTEQTLLLSRDTLEQQVLERTQELSSSVKQLEEQIEERKKVETELDFLANHDALTGLPSLRLYKDRLESSLAVARRSAQMTAVMFLDLDGFKTVNNTMGHEGGDQLLTVMAKRIQKEVCETDTIARIGGDEFIIILSDLSNIPDIKKIAVKIIKTISQPVLIYKTEVAVSASIGIALYPEHGATSDQLMRAADKAMYEVKKSGKNNFGFANINELKTTLPND
jgi:diguanylate cyclase (GGDEF)-like protein/PAS domain S-box-containing protein